MPSEGKLYTVITGDIVNSRTVSPQRWGKELRKILSEYSQRYDIYRGDSFQAVVAVEHTFSTIFLLLAQLQTISGIRARVGIGIGSIDKGTSAVRQSTGQAFIYSGEAFDALDKGFIAVRTPWKSFDATVELMLGLCTEIMGRWTVNMAESSAMALTHPQMNQKDMAILLNRKYQSQISTELNRAAFYKIQQVISYCTQLLLDRC